MSGSDQRTPPSAVPRVLADAEIDRYLLARLRELVFRAYAGDFAEADWWHSCGGWRIVLFEDDVPLAHAAVVPRLLQVGRRRMQTGYVEAVATTLERRGEGLGSLLMAHATSFVRAHFEMGALSTGKLEFYRRLGWESWQGPSSVRLTGTRRRRRTADEDDTIMVLRSGPSAAIDLATSIVCEDRPGDAW